MIDPKKTHTMDQGLAALAEQAAMMASYRDSLLREGWSRAEALQIVIAYQSSLLVTLRRLD